MAGFFMLDGIPPPAGQNAGLQLKDTAWRTLTNTGIANYVDYETLYAISGVYSIQEKYKSYSL